jgi:hypothetical protein
MKLVRLAWVLSTCVVGCGQRPETVTSPGPSPISTTPTAHTASIVLTRFPARAMPGDTVECEGTISIPPSLESRYTPRLAILLDGASTNQVRITKVRPGIEGPATFTQSFHAPDRPGRYELVVSFTVVPRVDPSQESAERGAGDAESVVESPRYPMEVAGP